MGINPQDVQNMHRAVQMQDYMDKMRQAQLGASMEPGPDAAPQSQAAPQQSFSSGHPMLQQSLQLIVNLMNASAMRQDLDFDVQTKGILTLAQSIQQLYASGHVEEIAQQHQMMLNEQRHANDSANQQAQMQLQTSQQAHQQAMDVARLKMEQDSHQQQMQQNAEMHKAKLLQLGHKVATDHEKTDVELALKAQQAQHSEEQHQQNVQHQQESHEQQQKQAQQASTEKP